MTRENKLALVLGFGLILFVGILISDHFSTAAQQQSADLLQEHTVDPLVGRGADDPQLIAWQRPPDPPAARPGPVATTTRSLTLDDHASPDIRRTPAETGVVRMPDLLQPPTEGPVQGGAPARSPGHIVVPRETLTSICRQHYGDGGLAVALAEYNGLADADSLRVGDRLRIPDAEELGVAPATRATPAAAARPPTSTRQSPPRTETYTVRDGDTLTEIAQRTLGSAGRWKKLYEANRDRITDPDRLLVGTTLTIPE